MDRDQPGDPYQYDPYAFEPTPADAPRPLRSRAVPLLLAGLAVVVLALSGVVAWKLLWSDGEAASATSATPLPPRDEPSPVEVVTVEVTREPATVEETTPADRDGTQGVASATPDPTPTAVPGQAEPAQDELDATGAVAALEQYLLTAVADPGAGWNLLARERQARESHASYVDWWGGLSSADVSNCRYDAPTRLALCDLLTTSDRGVSAMTRDVKFKLVLEDGLVKIGNSTDEVEVDADTARARQVLQGLRDEARASLVFDGRPVAVLSAKRHGISDPLQVAANGSNIFYLPDILAMHESLTARLRDVHVFVLHSEDWGKQKGQDLWYTVADVGARTTDDVEAWCERSFPELGGESLRNQCLPRSLDPPSGP